MDNEAMDKIVKEIDKQLKAMKAAGTPKWAVPSQAQGQQGVPLYGGIVNWLPPPTDTGPSTTVPVGVWYDADKDPVPPAQAVINLGPAPVPRKTRRQVSHNGKDWVDYRHLLDADDFECYAHRREV